MEDPGLPQWLIGDWTSLEASGSFPTIKDFNYVETVSFSTYGQPMFAYSSKSWHPETLKPMHVESGFLRKIPGNKQVALIASHNFGLTTLEEGKFDDKTVILNAKNISRISGAKDPAVTALERKITLLEDNKLEIVTSMATSNTPQLTHHLRAVYKRKE